LEADTMTRWAQWQQNNPGYTAAQDRGLFTTLWPSGGVVGLAPAISLGTMNVTVQPGHAAVVMSGTAGVEAAHSDAVETVTLAAAPPSGQSRIDLVVFLVRDQAVDAGSNNDAVMQAVTGTPAAANPAAPAAPANSAVICQVTVPGAAANLNSATLLDRRAFLVTTAAQAKTRVSRQAAWTITGGAACPYDTVSYDPLGLYNPATYVFRAPQAGDYLIVGAYTGTSTAAGQAFVAQINKNGTGIVNGATALATSSGQGITATVTDVVPCAAGDTVAIAQAAPSGLAGSPGTNGAYFTARLLA
jgi:hypothetical protein